MNQYHNANDGKFTFKGFFARLKSRITYGLNWLWFGLVWRILPLAIAAVATFAYSAGMFKNESIAYAAQNVPTVKAELKGLTVEQLENKLDAIVWGGESEKHVMKEGETFTTFDPPQSWPIEKCLKKGGKVNGECFSNGPRQEKVPTIQGSWPTFHNGEKITEQDARACAEDNECSKRFFLDRAELIQGGVSAWSAAHVGGDWQNPIKPEVQILIEFIREVRGIKI